MSVTANLVGGGRALERSPLARLQDRLLKWGLTGLAAAILLLIGFFFVKLAVEANPVFSKYGVVQFVFSNEWVPSKQLYGALTLVVGTLITSAIALAIGVQIAVAAALYITELCPRRLKQPLTPLVELLAAVPS